MPGKERCRRLLFRLGFSGLADGDFLRFGAESAAGRLDLKNVAGDGGHLVGISNGLGRLIFVLLQADHIPVLSDLHLFDIVTVRESGVRDRRFQSL